MWETIKQEILVCDCCGRLFAPSPGCSCVIWDHRWLTQTGVCFLICSHQSPSPKHLVIRFRNLDGTLVETLPSVPSRYLGGKNQKPGILFSEGGCKRESRMHRITGPVGNKTWCRTLSSGWRTFKLWEPSTYQSIICYILVTRNHYIKIAFLLFN